MLEQIKISRVKEFEQECFVAVRELMIQLVNQEQLPSKEQFVKLLNSANSQLFIAQLANSQIVGTMTIATYEIPSGKRLWIEDVVVDVDYRGKGIGRELITFAIEHCRSIGAQDIRLTSRPTRVNANKLYIKAGFKKSDTNAYVYHF
ncbi:MAG: GNAT family N-acetyltransferase [Bacteroidales bacterium]